MSEIVFMRRGDHVVEVEATEENLTPLMAQGYHQFHPTPAVEEEAK
jgi:hypothetical protein